jgi:hypothetical protein
MIGVVIIPDSAISGKSSTISECMHQSPLSEQFAIALRDDKACPDYNRSFAGLSFVIGAAFFRRKTEQRA